MTFEQWWTTNPDIKFPDDASMDDAIKMAMKMAYDAGRSSALDEMAAAVRIMKEQDD